MQAQDAIAQTDFDPGSVDLGPLAWVLEEVRKSLDQSGKALRRYVRELEGTRGSGAEPDVTILRGARQQLHQVSGALLMVGQLQGARMAEAMEGALERMLLDPQLCTDDAASRIERAGFALVEFLDSVLAGKGVSPVALFPQFREALELASADRVHPADLWPQPWRWQASTPPAAAPLAFDASVRGRLDPLVLRVVKTGDAAAARELHDISLGLAQAQPGSRASAFWLLAAGYFEALALGLLPLDLYTKRAASRVLLQFTTLAKGDPSVSERLAHDLLFFCAHAQPQPGQLAPTLETVRQAWRVTDQRPVNYLRPQLGLFDPALLAQARKRIEAAKELWSGLSGGDLTKLRTLGDAFGAVNESLLKIYPPSEPMVQALTAAVDTTLRAGKAPPAELAMEVATCVLYLEAAFEDLDPADPQLEARATQLAERLEGVRSGGQPRALAPWMEELFRRVSDRQTMGTVVGELRANLGELEKSMDQFFRNPAEKGALRSVPGQLQQMRGVLSVLGLDQATQAVLRMRDMVEEILVTEVDEARARQAGTFDKLGNNLGALGFLIDMLNYQPALAKKLFVYDAEIGELKPLMGRQQDEPEPEPDVAAPAAPPELVFELPLESAVQQVADQASGQSALDTGVDLTVRLQDIASQAALADQAGLARSAREASEALALGDAAQATQALQAMVASVAPPPAVPAPVPAGDDIGEDDLLDIFLEEAREVVGHGLEAIDALRGAPDDLGHLTTLRRAFHTLKGSSRMVGLADFGEAAWSLEQVLNTWLADQKPANDDLLGLAGEAVAAFARWAEAIRAGQAEHWRPGPFREAADALRLDGRRVSLLSPESDAAAPDAPVQGLAADVVDPFAPSATEGDEPTLRVSPSALDDFSFPPPADFSATQPPPVDDDAASDAAPPMGDLAFPAATSDGAADATAPEAPFDPPLDPFADVPLEAVSLTASGLEPAWTPEPAVTSQPAAEPTPEAAAVDALPNTAPAFEHTDWPEATAFDALPAEPAALPEAIEVRDIDFDSLAELSSRADAPPGSTNEFTNEIAPAEAAPIDGMVAPEGPAPADMAADAPLIDDQTKVIGPLRISIPLYNVYLNEADEWSRRLQTDVAEWALELHRPVSDNAVALAHSLAGSSATVGFAALSGLARSFEAALAHVQLLGAGTPSQAQLFNAVADEIRWLLHQFAAGFLKDPNPELQPALVAVCDTPVPDAPAPDRLGDADDQMTGWSAEGAPAGDAGPESMLEAPATLPPEWANEPAPVTAPESFVDAQVAPQPEPPRLADDIYDLQPAMRPDVLEPVSSPAAPNAAPPAVEPGFVAPAAVLESVVVADADDELPIDAQDAVDPDLFPIFEEEAVELLPRLSGALRQWAAQPGLSSARVEVLRNLHTLKGSARLAGAMRLGEMAHRMESRIEQFGSQETPPAEWVQGLLARFDGIQGTFESLRVADAQEQDAQAAAMNDVGAVDPGPLSELPPEAVSTLPPDALDPVPFVPLAPAAPISPRVAASAATNRLAPIKTASQQAVRVRSQLLDRLVNQAGEVMITRSRLEAEMSQLRGALGDLTGNLDRLRQQLRDIELQAESQMQSRLAQAKDSNQSFDPLEFDRFTRVQELTRMMAESVDDVATVQRTLQRTVQATEDDLNAQARQTRELQRDLLRTRMVEFEGISERLYRVVRQASKETGKQVKLDILGGSIEMDRGVLDRMTPAFEHLLRNCVAHGIETPDVRQGSGKESTGTISVDLRQEGNDVSVEFRDDGAGLNLDRIREKAVAQGLVGADQPLSAAEASQLIFMPGFSTATEVSEIAGRGIGMDVVRSEVNALGGRIETATEPGRGTSFRLVLPLTTAVTQVVMLRLGNQTFGVPSNLVELVRRASGSDLDHAYGNGSYAFAGEDVPFFWAGALLQSSTRSSEPQGKTAQVVVLRSASQRVALHVDEVLGNQEVVVKNLGPQLARLPGLAGMTVLSTGAVVLIYNPVALAAVYGALARALRGEPVAPPAEGMAPEANSSVDAPVAGLVESTPPQVPLILVVDDSITVRRVTQRLLQREGYRVALAADGLQALERLQDERPAVVLSDIEMPRMDGFDLARNIRNDAALAGLPIIMITSRIAEKHREHALQLGVNHYLGKPYSEEELLSLVRRYAFAEALPLP
jgi:chemosensory pili system protein ChpA (sensor histidine kinase/response regulator)